MFEALLVVLFTMLQEVAVMFEDLLVVRGLAGGQHINVSI